MQKPRWQKIKFDAEGNAYVTYYRGRHYLDEFMRLEDGKGYKSMSNSGAWVIEVDNEGEYARVSVNY